MLTIISHLLEAETLFHQLALETALIEPVVKIWRWERALPCTLGRYILCSLSGLRYLCPSQKPQERL